MLHKQTLLIACLLLPLPSLAVRRWRAGVLSGSDGGGAGNAAQNAADDALATIGCTIPEQEKKRLTL